MLAVLAVLALAACEAASGTPAPAGTPIALLPIVDVPTYKANALRTGVQPGPGILAGPVLAWTAELDCSFGGRAVTISGGTLVVGCDEPRLFALDARTGVTLWAEDLQAPTLGAVAIEDGQVLISTPINMEARSLVDGSPTWSVDDVSGTPNPTVANGVFFGGTRDGRLVGFRTSDKALAFEFDAGAPDDTAAGLAADGTATDGTVFASGDGGWFREIDWASAAERWSFQVRSGSVSSPAITTDIAYVAALTDGIKAQGRLYAIDRATGQERWSHDATAGRQIGPPIVHGDTVYAGSQDDGIVALDARTGDVRWTATNGGFVTPVATTGDVVYAVGSNPTTLRDGVFAVRASDGSPLWTIDLEARSGSSPVVSGGMLFITDDAGHVHAYAEPAMASLIAAVVPPAPSAAPLASGTPQPLPPLFGDATLLDSAALGLDHPGGMDVGPDGNVYLVNAGRSEILVISPDGALVRRWDADDTADGPLNFLRDPSDPDSVAGGVAVAPDGTVYVAESANARVRRFTPEGDDLGSFGRYGDEDAQFLDPIDVDVASDGTVLVVDDERDDIQRFDPDGKLLETIGRQGSGPGELLDTGGIHLDAQDRLYNADWGNNRIQAWAPDGTRLWALGNRGTGPGDFVDPRDVAADGSSKVFAVDQSRVQAIVDGARVTGIWTAPVDGLTAIQVVGDELWVAAASEPLVWRLSLEP